MDDDLRKPMRLLLYEGKYALASITVVMTSLGFVMALSVRAMTSTCVSHVLDVSNVTKEMCIASIVEGILSFVIVLSIAVTLIRVFVTMRRFPSISDTTC